MKVHGRTVPLRVLALAAGILTLALGFSFVLGFFVADSVIPFLLSLVPEL